MTIDFAELQARKNTNGILTADRYVGGFVACFEGADSALCPSKIFDMEEKAFEAMVKEASTRLTYSEVEPQLKIADSDLMTKAKELAGEEHAHVIEKALAVFENVMSVTDDDRDGDFMHTKGMHVDGKMPLLWMHMQVQPLGPFIGVTEHDEKVLKGMHAIAATKMGEDAVVLCELGALRTSIGFNPRPGQVTPRKTATVAGKKKVLSWEVKECDIMEDSLVSVPSCEDAVITAFSRKSLKHELVNHWAKGFYDARPVMTPGADLPDETNSSDDEGAGSDELHTKNACTCGGTCETCKAATSTETEPTSEDMLVEKGFTPEMVKGLEPSMVDLLLSDRVSVAPAEESSDEQTPGLVVKTVADGLQHKMYGMNDHYLPGSYEWICYKLDRKAKNYLVAQGVMDADNHHYVDVVATFADEVIICFGHLEHKRCFRASYVMNDDQPDFTGDVTEVEIKAEVVEKWFELKTKWFEGMSRKPEPEVTALDLAREICAKMVDGDDETIGDAVAMMKDASDVFSDHDEESLYGSLLQTATA